MAELADAPDLGSGGVTPVRVRVSPSAPVILSIWSTSVQHTLSNLDGCRREVKIELSRDELKPHFDEAYKRAQADVTLPGFRKGKVPLNMVKQKFGRDIENESLEAVADNEFRAYATSEELPVIGNPALTNIEKEKEGVTFTVVFEVLPEFELGDYRNLEVKRPVREVREEDVQEEIDRISLRAATFESAEEVTDEMHVVTVSLHELDKETSLPIIGAEKREDRVFVNDEQVDMHLRNTLMEKKVGDSFNYVAETKNEDEQPASHQVTLTDIQKVIPAEFNNEFAETITAGKFATTEELRADIESQLKAYFEKSSRDAIENQIVDTLVNNHGFDIPGSLVHSVIHQLFDDFKKRNQGAPGIDQLTAHDLEGEFKPSAERIVQWELIRNKIIDAENIQLEDDDYKAAAERYGIEEEQLRAALRQNRQIEDQLLAEKVMTTVIDYAVITDVNADDLEAVAHPSEQD